MSAAAIAVALALDHVVGEPPLAVHPVRWAGRALDRMAPAVPAAPPRRARAVGAVAWAVGAVVAHAIGRAVEASVAGRSPVVRATVRGLALWPLLSWRMLRDEVAAVEPALDRSLEAGRTQVARLVGRDVSRLDAPGVRAAAISSLAENVSDSVVAPLLWFAVGGVPAAATYRWANTADAMWGHRTARWRHAGWAAARADDLVNLVPSRLTGWALVAGSPRWRALPREARRTPSPNAGWPIAALALRLDVRCDKAGVYACHAQGRGAAAGDTTRAIAVASPRVWGVVAGVALCARRSRWRR